MKRQIGDTGTFPVAYTVWKPNEAPECLLSQGTLGTVQHYGQNEDHFIHRKIVYIAVNESQIFFKTMFTALAKYESYAFIQLLSLKNQFLTVIYYQLEYIFYLEGTFQCGL